MSKLPRIDKVMVEGPYTLSIRWRDGGRDRVDLSDMVSGFPPFAPLKDESAFNAAEVVDSGTGVQWPGGLDISATVLHRLANEQRWADGQ